jgi:hypothetical protein
LLVPDPTRIFVILGSTERDGVLVLVDTHLSPSATLGADKGYDTHDFVE